MTRAATAARGVPSAVAVLLIASIIGGCAVGSAATSGTTLTVYGAASLRDVLSEVTSTYAAANPGMNILVSTGSSSALETQIEQGAPADVFLSADTTNPQTLVDKGLTDGSAVSLAANTLVVIVPTDDPAGITTPADLARPGVKIVAAGDEVPITRYANQVVAALANQPGYPADFMAAYDANIVSKEDDVRAAVAKVELGEGDAAIVYRTDATASARIATIAIPDDAEVRATYAGVVIKGSAQPVAARAFLTWLGGPVGQEIFVRFGFLPVS